LSPSWTASARHRHRPRIIAMAKPGKRQSISAALPDHQSLMCPLRRGPRGAADEKGRKGLGGLGCEILSLSERARE
jgi:hypothetical protein